MSEVSKQYIVAADIAFRKPRKGGKGGGEGRNSPVGGATNSSCDDAAVSENFIVATSDSTADAAADDDMDKTCAASLSSPGAIDELRANSQPKNSTQGTTPVAETTKSQPRTAPDDVFTYRG